MNSRTTLMIEVFKAQVVEADARIEAEPENDEALAGAENAYARYWQELDAARALQARYESLIDPDASGITNAGDTFGPAYGDIRFLSTEYWACAIKSVQF